MVFRKIIAFYYKKYVTPNLCYSYIAYSNNQYKPKNAPNKIQENIIHDKDAIATCFGTGVPSSGDILEQRNASPTR